MPSAAASYARVKTSRLFRTLFLGLILLMAVVLVSVFMEIAAIEVREKLDNAVRLERDLGLLYATLQEAESGQRGYLLTHNDRYLDPYRAALDTIYPILDRLTGEVRTDTLQQLRLRHIHSLTDSKFLEMGKALTYDVRRDSMSLKDLVQSHIGQQFMDEIRATIDLVRQDEASDVARRQAQVARLATITTILRFIGVLGLAGGVLLYFYPDPPAVLQYSAGRQRPGHGN